jgi:hypothetical protein
MGRYRTGRRAPFAMVPHALMKCPKIDSYALAVYCAIRAHADHETGEGAWPSDARLSEWAGCSERTVRNRRNLLRELGWIEWESGQVEGTSNSYLVHDVLAEPEPTGGSAPDAGGSAPGAGGVGARCRGGSAPGADYQDSVDRDSGPEEFPNGNRPDKSGPGGGENPDPAPWMHEAWQAVLGSRRPLTLTDARRKKYRAMYREQLASAPEPKVAWRAVLYAVTRSTHHMSRRTYQMPESLLLNPERRERWVEEAIETLAGGTNGKKDRETAKRRQDLLDYLKQRKRGRTP